MDYCNDSLIQTIRNDLPAIGIGLVNDVIDCFLDFKTTMKETNFKLKLQK